MRLGELRVHHDRPPPRLPRDQRERLGGARGRSTPPTSRPSRAARRSLRPVPAQRPDRPWRRPARPPGPGRAKRGPRSPTYTLTAKVDQPGCRTSASPWWRSGSARASSTGHGSVVTTASPIRLAGCGVVHGVGEALRQPGVARPVDVEVRRVQGLPRDTVGSPVQQPRRPDGALGPRLPSAAMPTSAHSRAMELVPGHLLAGSAEQRRPGPSARRDPVAHRQPRPHRGTRPRRRPPSAARPGFGTGTAARRTPRPSASRPATAARISVANASLAASSPAYTSGNPPPSHIPCSPLRQARVHERVELHHLDTRRRRAVRRSPGSGT
jgi:hypothetical protein